MPKILIQLFGGGGGSSGGNFRITGHKTPNTGKPNSRIDRYDRKGKRIQTRHYDADGKPKKDIDYSGAPNDGPYPHEHDWYYNEDGDLVRGEKNE